MGDFNRLVAWQKSRSFTQRINVAFKAGGTTVPGLRSQNPPRGRIGFVYVGRRVRERLPA
jgi:endonuclease/exonuclease/phosphatase family metal-dependent hydrolase